MFSLTRDNNFSPQLLSFPVTYRNNSILISSIKSEVDIIDIS
uniref:Uncharacterized protein n=1 Tax=Myoviridae sp. ct2cn10 TaxID=2825022 RepID=A0A8S5PAE5_9CAUD|nr:MAG TPA: hypothetical protein [Myoviridae sp. ct2cn10]